MFRYKRKSRRYIDYENEIPFERRAPRGFYDTSKEDDRAREETEHARSHFKPMFITDIEGERRDTIEERERKKDKARQIQQKKLNLPAVLRRLNELNGIGVGSDAAEIASAPSSLSLPKPIVGDDELAEMARFEKSGLADLNHGNATSSVTSLLMKRDAASAATPRLMSSAGGASVRTPALKGDRIMTEAKNALLITAAQTPLLGETSEPLLPSDRSAAQRTPSALSSAATEARRRRGASGKRLSKRKRRGKQRGLVQSLEGLPEPEHDYLVAMPRKPQPTSLAELKAIGVLDRSEMARKRELKGKKDDLVEWAKRSAVMRSRHESKQGAADYALPTTRNGFEMTLLVRNSEGIERMIVTEQARLMKVDSSLYDDHSGRMLSDEALKLKFGTLVSDKSFDRFEVKEMKRAQDLIAEEMARMRAEHPVPHFDQLLAKASANCAFNPAAGCFEIFSSKTYDISTKVAARSQEFAMLRQQLNSLMKSNSMIEQKVDILTKGYRIVAKDSLDDLNRLRARITAETADLKSFSHLRDREVLALKWRLNELRSLHENEKRLHVSLKKKALLFSE